MWKQHGVSRGVECVKVYVWKQHGVSRGRNAQRVGSMYTMCRG